MYMFPIAAGLMAGEGLGGVVGAILAVANVDGSSEFLVLEYKLILRCCWLTMLL